MRRLRLNAARLDRLAAHVERPEYDPAGQTVGIVHLGIGAFHRAHQAVYTDDAMKAGGRDWRIKGVSLRSAGVRDELVPQDCLYTVTERDADGTHTRLVGSISDVLVAPENPLEILSSVAAVTTKIVSLTVTEKGYCRASDGSLDGDHPDLKRDLGGEDAPLTLYGFLAEGLKRRREAGLDGLTVLSCDNLAHNGATLDALLTEFLQRRSPDLARWYARTCACPSTMVDRIVPAPTPAERDEIGQTIGVFDAAAIVTEPFRQWVIEDRFAAGRPAWERVGAELVADVVAYEAAKLRMLNGAHSALAYMGLLRGHTFVHEAIADPQIRPVIERLMLIEVAPTLTAARGERSAAYSAALISRFANSALPHQLTQIAMDGSEKISERWLGTLRDAQTMGRSCPSILQAIAAWLVFVRADRFAVIDPLANTLKASWAANSVAQLVRALFGAEGHFRAVWVASDEDVIAIVRAIEAVEEQLRSTAPNRESARSLEP